MSIKVLQCGYQKSGNYGVYKIIRYILEANNLFTSFNIDSGISKIINIFFSDMLSFPEWSEVDMFFIKNKKIMLYFPSNKYRYIPINHNLFISTSSLLWTHDIPEIICHPILKPVTHSIYVLRDGRDVVNSGIHYSIIPQQLNLFPEYKYTTVDELYNDLDLFGYFITHWKNHLCNYLDNKSSFYCIRLEDIMDNFYKKIHDIAEFLGLSINIEDASKALKFDKMAKSAPNHMRKGKKADWKNYFRPEHINIFKDIAGDLLIELGYEKDKNW